MSIIHEVCSCGAKFYCSTFSSNKSQIAAMMWREQHIHDSPKLKDDPEEHELHDSELDAYVERADHRDANPAAELDHRTRMGFQPKQEGEI